jgi:3-dehydroquinate dehydratase II
MARRILLINGANLNMLGTREPEIYGTATLNDVVVAAEAQAKELGVELDVFQSNHEGAIVDRIQEAGGFGHLVTTPVAGDASRKRVDAIIINPGGFTHTSVVIRDALLGVSIPFIELHVSQVHAREAWRHHSYFHDKATAVIAGLGAHGYTVAIEYAAKHLKVKPQ